MTAVIEWLGSGLLKILDMFKNPELIKPEPQVIEIKEELTLLNTKTKNEVTKIKTPKPQNPII